MVVGTCKQQKCNLSLNNLILNARNIITSLIFLVIILSPTEKFAFIFLEYSVTITWIFLSNFLNIATESEASQSEQTDITKVITAGKHARHSRW